MKRSYAIACVALMTACGGDETLTLSESSPDRSDQYAERRRLLNIRVIDSNNQEQEYTPAQLANVVSQDCTAKISGESKLPNCNEVLSENPSFSCEASICHTHHQLCIANTLLEIAQSVTAVTVVCSLRIDPHSRV